MSTKIQYDLELPGLSDVADITVISNDIQKIADELDLRPRMVDGVIPFEILFSHKDAALTILNETDVYSQLINSGTQYINFIDTNGENTALIQKERTSGNNGDNTLSILLRGLNGNYYGMTIHDNGLAQRITGVTPTVSGLDDETIPTMNYLNSSKATKLVHTDLAETITGSKTFTGQPIMSHDDDNFILANPSTSIGTIPTSNKAIAMLFRGAPTGSNYGFVGYVAGSDGSGLIRQRAYNYNRSASADLLVKCYADGSKWAECPTPPANAPSNAIVTKAEVYGTDNLSNNLVHTIGDESVGGNKVFTGIVRFDGVLDNQYWGKTCRESGTYQKVYEYDGSGAQYRSGAFIVMQRRNVTRNGILLFINNRNAGISLKWLVKTENINPSDFVATREGNAVTIWVKSTGSTSDGYQFMKLIESASSGRGSDIYASDDTGAYAITSSGYTDSSETVHTFSYYTESIA